MPGTVSNSYYTRAEDYEKLERAKGPEVEAEFYNVQTGFDAVEAMTDQLAGEISELDGAGSVGWPASLNSRFTVTCTGTDALSGTAPGSPDSSDTIPDETHLIIIPANDNTGAATLNIGTTEGAEPIKKDVAGTISDLASGDLRAGIPYLMVYDASNDYWTVFIPNLNTSPTVLFKSADYTITSGNVDAPSCTVCVDASGGSVDIDLPTVANLSGKLAEVMLYADPGTNNVEVYQSDGTTEVWTGVAKGDRVRITSDGTNYIVLDHYEGHYCRVYLSADEAVAQGTSEQLTTFAEDLDTGGIWDAATDNELDIPFDCWVDIHYVMIAGLQVVPEISLDATQVVDATVYEGGAPEQALVVQTLSCRIKADSGEKLQLMAHNLDTNSGNTNVHGDAAGDETFATIKLTRIY